MDVAFGSLLDKLKGTSSPLEKQEILMMYDRAYPEVFREFMFRMFEPFKVYHLRLSERELPAPGELDLSEAVNEAFSVLDFCEESMAPAKNKQEVMVLMKRLNRGSQLFLLSVLRKSLKAGIGKRGVMQIFPDLISNFEVQLAMKYDPDDMRFSGISHWWGSPKLDGLRCIALRRGDGWKLFSRKGKEIVTADFLKPQLEEIYSRTGITMLDGELYRHGLHFEEIQGMVMSRNHPNSAKGLKLNTFVTGSSSTFLRGGLSDYQVASESLKGIDGLEIEPVPQALIPNTQYDILNVHNRFKSSGYEGLMLRNPDQLYYYGRNHLLLKVKMMDSFDCKVVGADIGEMPVIEDGRQVVINALLAFEVIQPNGVRCRVGSGFDIPFREEVASNPDKYIGKTIEVQYQNLGSNGAMRFPVYKCLRLDKSL